MNVIPEKLMHSMKCDPAYMAAQPGRVGRWKCPLHPDADGSLSATCGPRVVFTCANPSCRFRGDAATLVSLARKIPLEDALALFRPGAELADCMAEPISDEDAALYLETAGSQSALKAYLAKCVRAARLNPEYTRLRTGMSRTSLRLLHPDVGLFLRDPQVPRCLSEFLKPKYAKSCLLLFPYTFNGEVTKIEVADALDPKFGKVAVVTNPDLGVFGETLAEGKTRIFAVEGAAAAAKLYAAYAVHFSEPAPVAAFSAYPLPESCRSLTNLDLFSSYDAEISTGMLLKTLSAPEIKPGRQPAARMLTWGGAIGSVRRGDFEAFAHGGGPSCDCQYAVAKRFSSLVGKGSGKSVLDALASVQVPAVVRNLIKSTVENQLALRGGFGGNADATSKVVELLDAAPDTEPCSMSLANGKVLHCGPDGIFAIRLNGVRDPIANVGISVDARVVRAGRNGGSAETFDCTVSARGGFPAVKVRFAWRDLTADRMRAIVQKAYADMGLSPYVAFYSSAGFAWRDVMSKLAENCQVEREKEPEAIRLKARVKGGSVKIGPVR